MNFNLSENILIQSIEHSNLAHTISRLDEDMELMYVNQAFLDKTGYERDEVIGRNCRFLQGEGTDPDAINQIKAAIANLQTLDIEILNYKKDGTPFWNRLMMAPVYDDNKEPVAYIGIQSDVTQAKEEQRLEQERQKLEALGRMTANISHEIKNTFQPVKLMSDMLQDWENLDQERIQRCLEILSENVELAAYVVNDVLRFSRKAEVGEENILVSDLIAQVPSYAKNLVHSRIQLEIQIEDMGDNDHSVILNLNGLYQVMMNLINNAIFAIKDSGVIRLYMYPELVNEESASTLGLRSGEYICIAIEDDGDGMDEKIASSAFDPFFSTKSPGDGTGLGLSISYRIVKSWNGTIKLESELDKGSTLTIYLPVA